MIFIKENIGLFAGLLSASAYVFYIISIFNGKTKPSRSTWWILTIVGVLIFTSSYSIGARENMWIQLTYMIGPLFIAFLSLNPKYGYGSQLSLTDKTCLVGACLCAILWILFDAPFVAFLGSIVVDFVGLVPTIKKAYVDPHEESLFAWTIEITASVVNALGITMWFTLSDKNWIYASYMIFVNGIVFLLLLRNLKKQN